MRILLFLILSSLLMLGGYWVVASQMIERQVAALIAASAQITGTPRSVTGFPLSFHQIIEAPHWRSRDGQSGWNAPELTLHAASYQPNRITAQFPHSQMLHLGTIDTVLHTTEMTGQVTIGADQHLRAARLMIESAALSPALLIESAQTIRIFLEQTAGERYGVQAQADALHLAPEIVTLIAPGMAWDATQIERLSLTAVIDLTSPLQFGASWPDLTALDLTQAHLNWGALQIAADGRIERSASGVFDGKITLQVADWQPLLALLQQHDILPPDAAVMAAMFFAAQSEPGTNRLSLPLELRDSILSLGPIALMQLPSF